jgi:hypothetical protein
LKHYITQIPQPMMSIMWPHLEPLLAKALSEARGEFTMDHLREMADTGTMLVLAIFKGQEVVAALTVERVLYPGKVTMRVALLGGEGMDEWVKDLNQHLSTMAMAMGAKDIEIAGRRGWARALDGFGYEVGYTILNKKIQAQTGDTL